MNELVLLTACAAIYFAMLTFIMVQLTGAKQQNEKIEPENIINEVLEEAEQRKNMLQKNRTFKKGKWKVELKWERSKWKVVTLYMEDLFNADTWGIHVDSFEKYEDALKLYEGIVQKLRRDQNEADN